MFYVRGLLLVPGLAVCVIAQAGVQLLTTSFEAPTYTAGQPLHNQAGWSAATGFTVSNEQARFGSQSLKWSGTGGVFATDPTYKKWIDNDTFFHFSIYIDPSTTSLDRYYGVQLYKGSTTVAGIAITSSGAIRFGVTAVNSPIIGYVGTPKGRWIDFVLVMPIADARYAMVDNKKYMWAGETQGYEFDTVTYMSNSRVDSTQDPGTAYFDVVPEPVSLIGLAAGMVAFASRRRARA